MITVGLCAIVIMLGLNAVTNISTTKDVEQAIKDTNPTVEVVQPTPVEITVENNNDELVAELKEELQELKSKQDETMDKIDGRNEMSSTTVVKNGERTVQIHQDPWTGPRSYKCNKMAGYSAICEYCGGQGGIHYDIKEWQDTQGTYHVTHKSCGRNLCEAIGVEPRIEENYKLK